MVLLDGAGAPKRTSPEPFECIASEAARATICSTLPLARMVVTF
jgi:hypothetical protein